MTHTASSMMLLDASPKWDVVELKRTLGTFVTGVTVVTTIDASGNPRGMTANSFTSVSLDPPLVLVCIAKSSSNHIAFRDADGFAINILAEGQNDVATRFARRIEDRFAGVDWSDRATGSPILDEAAAWLDCSRHEVLEMGDHIIMVGRVEAFERQPQLRPLAYVQGNFISFALMEREMQRLSEQTRVAAIVEVDDKVVLFRSGNRWGLGFQAATEALSHAESVNLSYAPHGGRVELSFLYSVYRTADRRQTHLIYRGDLAHHSISLDPTIGLFAEHEFPWDQIDPVDTKIALQRYFAERRQGRFGIYVHDEAGGQVSLLSTEPTRWAALEL